MSKTGKILAFALGLLILGGIALVSTQSNFLKGNVGSSPTGTMSIPTTASSTPSTPGTGGTIDITGQTPMTGGGIVGPGTPGTTGGGTTSVTANIYIDVSEQNGDFISGLTELNFTSSPSFVSFTEYPDSYYHAEMTDAGDYDISVSKDGYITTSDTFSAIVADDVISIQTLVLPYSHVVNVIDENGTGITSAAVKVGNTGSKGGSGMLRTCDNFDSNEYGCNNPASSVRNQYTVSASGYENASGSFSAIYRNSSTSSVTVIVTLIAIDEDGDGLDTTEENTAGTDPLNPDTDGGTVNDGTEVLTNGTDPLDETDDIPDVTPPAPTPTPAPIPTPTPVIIETNTSFSCSSVTISPSSYELDANVSKQDISFSVTISFDSLISMWQKSLFNMVTLASTETFTDKLTVNSSGAGIFEEAGSGDPKNPLSVDINTTDGTAITLDFNYTDAEEGHVINAYLESDTGCKDKLTITQITDASGDDDTSSADDDDDNTTTVTVTDNNTDTTYTTTTDTILLSESYNCTDYFTDNDGDWSEDIICRMYKASIVEGRDPPYTFDIDGDVTNAEAIKMIVGLFVEDKDTDGLTEGFTDVSNSDWYSDSVKLAEDADIIRTRDFGGYFFPDVPCPRGQLALYVTRAIGQTTWDYPDNFRDVKHDDYFAYAVALLSDEDKSVDVPYDSTNDLLPIIEGYSNGDFLPYKNTSRAEALAMIYRAYLYMNQ